ncbi:MAG: ParB/RepB/Spo0J family partition protein [Candidatus Moranbacteria bacterium]|nr:ParB/RepB/Spo0J family partition protein [Candidatus Moranbacteria bacterium]
MKEKIYSEIETIDPLKVNPNKYNPNLMSKEKFESLVEDFKENGWIGQPVVVNDNLQIIDGFHRWKAAMALKFQAIPIVKFHPKSEEHQKILTIALNSKRGEMNPLKLASLISELNKKYNLEELSMKLGYGVNDIKDKLSLMQVTPEFVEKLKRDVEEREKEVPVVMNFAVSKEQKKVINEALERVKGKSKGERLYSICSRLLSQE